MKIKKILKILFVLFLLFISSILAINSIVVGTGNEYIKSIDEIKEIKDVDCILVLGAGLSNNGPSLMLQERLDTSINLYNLGVSDKLLMSGDHLNITHDEVNVMKDYAISKNISSSSIFMDHAGISTYDSMYRAKHIFGAKRIVIVTQKYHLYRALYIANKLGLDAFGVDASKNIYFGQTSREIREILARVKDFVKVKLKPISTYGGDKISLKTSGNETNDAFILITSYNSNNEYYIHSSISYKKINNIINAHEFKVRKCKGIKTYNININNEVNYDIEVFDDIVHLIKVDEVKEKEIRLNEHESREILNIILPSKN